MGFNACTCSLDPLDPTSNTHGTPTKCPVNALNRRATVRGEEALGTDALCWGVVRGRAEACDRAYSQFEKVKVPGAEDQEELEAADSSSKDRGLMESDPKGSSKKMSTEDEKPDAAKLFLTHADACYEGNVLACGTIGVFLEL